MRNKSIDNIELSIRNAEVPDGRFAKFYRESYTYKVISGSFGVYYDDCGQGLPMHKSSLQLRGSCLESFPK